MSNVLLQNHAIAWFGQRGLDSVGLEQYLDLQMILCCDYGWDTQLMLKSNKPIVVSLEAKSGHRENWSSHQLDRVIDVAQPHLDVRLTENRAPLWIVAYSASRSLVHLASSWRGHIRVLMPAFDLKEHLDNKVVFAQIIRQLDLPSPATQVVAASTLRNNRNPRQPEFPFVAQLPIGSSGTGTFFVDKWDDLGKLDGISDTVPILLRAYVEGISLNVNACVMGHRIAISRPSVQLVGLPACTIRKELYCGNDFTAASDLPRPILQKCERYVAAIGDWLSRHGYSGMFGVDLVGDLNTLEVYPIDLNPRYQNSTHLLTQIAVGRQDTPMAVMSIAWEMGRLGYQEVLEWEKSLRAPHMGSQIILRSLHDGLSLVKGTLLPGVYSDRGGGIHRLRSGLTLLDANTFTNDEFVLSCGVPYPGTVVHPNASLLKIFHWGTVCDAGTGQLNSRFDKICRLIYQELNLQPL